MEHLLAMSPKENPRHRERYNARERPHTPIDSARQRDRHTKRLSSLNEIFSTIDRVKDDLVRGSKKCGVYLLRVSLILPFTLSRHLLSQDRNKGKGASQSLREVTLNRGISLGYEAAVSLACSGARIRDDR
jgi:hypothetical protein